MNSKNYVVRLKPHDVVGIAPILGQLDIELTERCNNACIHCLINQPENDEVASSSEMNTEFVKSVLCQAADLGCLTVRFTGGEPLLRKDLAELYVFARRLGMRVILFTNARLITPEIGQLLAQFPPGRVVEVSVYGMHPKSYDTVTAKSGAFTEFWQGMEILREFKIPFIVKQSVLPPNEKEMLEFEAFASGLPDMQHKPDYTMNFDLRARRDNPQKNKLIKKLRLTPEETVEMLKINPDYRKGMHEFIEKFMRSSGDKLFQCTAGHSICIDAYGKVQMCMGLRHPDMVYGLTLQPDSQTKNETGQPGSLRYALKTIFPSLRQLRAKNPDYLHRCAHCFLKGLCEQCPAKSWMEHGTLDTPVEYLCHVAHAQARYLGLVKENENSWELNPPIWQDRVASFTASCL